MNEKPQLNISNVSDEELPTVTSVQLGNVSQAVEAQEKQKEVISVLNQSTVSYQSVQTPFASRNQLNTRVGSRSPSTRGSFSSQQFQALTNPNAEKQKIDKLEKEIIRMQAETKKDKDLLEQQVNQGQQQNSYLEMRVEHWKKIAQTASQQMTTNNVGSSIILDASTNAETAQKIGQIARLQVEAEGYQREAEAQSEAMKEMRSKLTELQVTLEKEQVERKDAEWKLQQLKEEKESSLKMSKQGALFEQEQSIAKAEAALTEKFNQEMMVLRSNFTREKEATRVAHENQIKADKTKFELQMSQISENQTNLLNQQRNQLLQSEDSSKRRTEQLVQDLQSVQSDLNKIEADKQRSEYQLKSEKEDALLKVDALTKKLNKLKTEKSEKKVNLTSEKDTYTQDLERKLQKVKTQKEELLDENSKLAEQVRKIRNEKDEIEDLAQITKDRFTRQEKYREEVAQEETQRQVDRLNRQQKDQLEMLEAQQKQTDARHQIEAEEKEHKIASLKKQLKDTSSKIDQTMNSSKYGIMSACGPQNLVSPFGEKRQAQTPNDLHRTYIMPKLSSPMNFNQEKSNKKREKGIMMNLNNIDNQNTTQTEYQYQFGDTTQISKNQQSPFMSKPDDSRSTKKPKGSSFYSVEQASSLFKKHTNLDKFTVETNPHKQSVKKANVMTAQTDKNNYSMSSYSCNVLKATPVQGRSRSPSFISQMNKVQAKTVEGLKQMPNCPDNSQSGPAPFALNPQDKDLDLKQIYNQLVDMEQKQHSQQKPKHSFEKEEIQKWYRDGQEHESLSAIQQVSDEPTLNLFTPPSELQVKKKALDTGAMQSNHIDTIPMKDLSSSQKKRRYRSDLTDEQQQQLQIKLENSENNHFMPGKDVLLTGTDESDFGEQLSTMPPQKPEDYAVGPRNSGNYFQEILSANQRYNLHPHEERFKAPISSAKKSRANWQPSNEKPLSPEQSNKTKSKQLHMHLQQNNPCFDQNIVAVDNENFRTGGFATDFNKPSGDNFQFISDSDDEGDSTAHIKLQN